MKQFTASRRALLAAAVLSAFGLSAHAQAWPTKSIRLVVAGPAGGSADILARLIADPMSKDLGQPIVVDNKVGAGGAIAVGGLVLVGNPTLPAANLKDLVSYAKTKPGLSYASYSPGSLSHVMGQQLNKAAGIDLTHVGYKGSTTALTDVMGNHVPLMFDGVPTSLPLIKGGKLKAYAVSTPTRLPQLPDVPTFREAGYPQLEALAWMGLWSSP